MSQPQSTHLARWLLPAIVATYVAIAVLFAVYTPAWQAPDEPAHYNYVRYLAEQHRFPILKWGDYPAAYLDEIKAARFPPDMAVDPIRYEFHQPPLYYLLAVPIYQLFGGALLPLRLLSVALGALILLFVYAIVRELCPASETTDGTDTKGHWLALGATAFVAFLPMHVAVTAAMTNDPLAELLLAAVLLLTIRYVKLPAGDPAESRTLATVGIATGVALVCKAGLYIAVPLVLAAILLRLLMPATRQPGGALVRAAGLYLLPAAGLALPWWLRNAALYGGADLLGLGRHEQVVAGQLRTADYVAAHGLGHWLADFFTSTFRSFWGQFGWMGVVLDERLYLALAVLSGLAIAGLLAWLAARLSGHRRPADPCCATPRQELRQHSGLALLSLAALLVIASYIWYNLQFVQFQGRYLFPASAAIGLAMAVGWREALQRERAWLIAGLLLAGAALLAPAGLLRHDLPGWPLLLLAGAAVALAVRARLPRRWDALAQVAPYLLLPPLDLVCLFLFIVPQLAP